MTHPCPKCGSTNVPVSGRPARHLIKFTFKRNHTGYRKYRKCQDCGHRYGVAEVLQESVWKENPKGPNTIPVKIRGKIYKSAAEAARQLGVCTSTVYGALDRGTVNNVGLGKGRTFKPKNRPRFHRRSKPVPVFNGHKWLVYPTMKEFAEDNGKSMWWAKKHAPELRALWIRSGRPECINVRTGARHTPHEL